MGTITISISNETEKELRETIREQNSIRKGVLGKTIQEAIELWMEKKHQEDISKRQLKLLKNAYNMGKYSFKREELYERE